MRWDVAKRKTPTARAATRARSSNQRRSRPTFRGACPSRNDESRFAKPINPTNENDPSTRDAIRNQKSEKRTAMRPRVSRRLAASAVVMAARATVLRSARLLSFAGAATREQRVVEVIANMMMIDASAFL